MIDQNVWYIGISDMSCCQAIVCERQFKSHTTVLKFRDDMKVITETPIECQTDLF